tara:strand:+ start:707 stop:904 length:198 start_codon:yes stop_codon:yes gene_type:complete
MSVTAWKQWILNFIHNRPADDDWVEILIDFLGLWPVWGSVITLVVSAFIFTIICCELDMRRSIEE